MNSQIENSPTLLRTQIRQGSALTIVSFAISLLLCSRGLMAQQPVSNDQPFVDLDGDGISDMVPDLNEDGIPDERQGPKRTSDTAPTDRFAILTSDLRTGLVLPELGSMQLSQKFGRRLFITRGIRRFRSSFEGGLGVDSGLGFGSALGNFACASGLCGPGFEH